MQWDLNQGRYTTILPGGEVAHAWRVDEGWELLVPALEIRHLLRNPRLKTWSTAQAVVEIVLRRALEPSGPGALLGPSTWGPHRK